jgi:4-hydroxy-2-oxoheptanedioate aldolase
LQGIVLGRVDMTGSMGLTREDINIDQIFNIANVMSEKIKATKKDMVIGGGVSAQSLPFFKKLPYLSRFETRKIIFDAQTALKDNDADKGILKAVGFELMWLKNKREFYKMIFDEDAQRLILLESRYKSLIKDAGGMYE